MSPLHRHPRKLLSHTIPTALNNLQREPHLWIALLSLALPLFLLQILIGGYFLHADLLSYLTTQSTISVEIQTGTPDDKKQEFFAALRSLPAVRNIDYITREHIYEQTRTTNPDLITFIEKFQVDNPFRDTLSITLSSLENYHTVYSFLENEQWKNTIESQSLPQANREGDHITSLLHFIRPLVSFHYIILVLTLLLFCILFLFLSHFNHLRKADLHHLSLLGAPSILLILPTILETFLIALGTTFFTTTLLLSLLSFIQEGYFSTLSILLSPEISPSFRFSILLSFPLLVIITPLLSLIHNIYTSCSLLSRPSPHALSPAH